MAYIQEPGDDRPDSAPNLDAEAFAAALHNALNEGTSDRARALMRQVSVLVSSELCGLLDEQGEADFHLAKAYCKRWDTEGPPRPSTMHVRVHVEEDYDPFERMEREMEHGFDPWADKDRGRQRRMHQEPPQPMWDAEATQRWRGRLRASLKVIFRNRSHAVDPKDPTGTYVTVEEAAERLQVPERTIRNWVNRKSDPLSPVDKLGGSRSSANRYRLSDLRARMPRTRPN